MGKASKAPYSHYVRRMGITNKAIQRFREYLEDIDSELRFREDDDLGNLIDDIVGRGMLSKNFIEVNDADEGHRYLVMMNDGLDMPLRAVLKKDPKQGPPNDRVVVTIMPEDMVQGLIAKGKMHQSGADVKTSLSANPVLQGMKAASGGPPAAPEGKELRLITWTEIQDGSTSPVARSLEVIHKDLQKNLMMVLAQGVNPKSIRVWKTEHVELAFKF